MKLIALDLETTGLDPRKDRVRLAQLYDGKEVKILDVFKVPETMDYLVRLVEDSTIRKVLHNAKFDLSFIRAYAGRRLNYSNIWDTLLAEQVLTAGWYQPWFDPKSGEMKRRFPEYNLQAVVQRHLGFKLEKDMQRSNWGSVELTEQQLKYAARDVEVLLPIYEIQKTLLEKNNLMNVAQLEFDTLAPIIEMELCGMPFVWSKAEALRVIKTKEMEVALKDLEKEARGNQKSKQMTLFGGDAGVDINFSSPMQITRYIRDKLGIEVDSSDVETLKGIDHPFAAKLLKYRTIQKQLQFITQLDEFGGRSGRLYPQYNQARAQTGRMSSSRFNLQQMPKRGEGKVFRSLFCTTPGYKLVKADFSAVEFRITAALAHDQAALDAVNNGQDLHKLTAHKTSHVPIDQVTKEQRQRAKAIGFGLLFGAGAPTLQKYAKMQYGVVMTEAESIQAREDFFALYKGIAKWHDQEKHKLYYPASYWMHKHNEGFIEYQVVVQKTAMGRKRFWPSWSGETQAKPTEIFNTAVQGSAADLLKCVLVRLYKELPKDVAIIAAIHDEVVCEVPEEKAEAIKELMVRIMREEGSKIFAPMPIDAEGEIGDAWG
jgi:DNA polymerase I